MNDIFSQRCQVCGSRYALSLVWKSKRVLFEYATGKGKAQIFEREEITEVKPRVLCSRCKAKL